MFLTCWLTSGKMLGQFGLHFTVNPEQPSFHSRSQYQGNTYWGPKIVPVPLELTFSGQMHNS